VNPTDSDSSQCLCGLQAHSQLPLLFLQFPQLAPFSQKTVSLVSVGFRLATREVAMEILTADEVAAWLKISKRHVYELVKQRTKSGDVRKDPLRCIRLGKSIRFNKAAVEEWIERLSAHNVSTDG
jgi:predicted DNA-binding transcriptional regulator AlpA